MSRDHYSRDHDDRDARYKKDDEDGRYRRDDDRRDKRARSNSRNRDKYRDNNRSERESFSFKDRDQTPSCTVMVKGLPSHTTEATLYAAIAAFSPQEIRLIAHRESGECKGFAFVEFYSVEYSAYFMQAFAGSSGDPHAPQLIVDMRAVTLDYSNSDRKQAGGGGGGGGGGAAGSRCFEDSGGSGDKRFKGDWLCECGCQNFARRFECYKCSAPRTASSAPISGISGSEAFSDTAIGCDKPSQYLTVKGLGIYVNEDQISELFRQFAVVKSVFIVRDWVTTISKGIAFVEFHTVEHATYALQSSAGLQLDRHELKVSFARESFRLTQVAGANTSTAGSRQSHQGTAPMALIAAAMLQQQQQQQGWAKQGATDAGSAAAIAAARSKSKPLWPPCFETSGGSYAFQPQSGYFYEALSEFYYCPKSKLYYNALEGIYFHYDASLSPPFKRFLPPVPSEPPSGATDLMSSSVGSDADKSASNVAAAALARKPVIVSMSLGGAAGKSKPKAVSSSTSSAAPTGLTKQIESNLAKWDAAKKEDSAVDAVKPMQITKSATAADVVEQSTGAAAPDASSGGGGAVLPQFACYLCRRQFTSADQLQRHESQSKLHADNVALQLAQTAGAGSSAESKIEYRDRASERRQIHHQSAQPMSIRAATRMEQEKNSSQTTIQSSMFTSTASLTTERVSQVPVHSDVSNPGNLLLRKMGWSEGKGLGKDEHGSADAVGVTVTADALLPGCTAGLGSDNKPLLASSDSNYSRGDKFPYRENMAKIARARYMQLEKDTSH